MKTPVKDFSISCFERQKNVKEYLFHPAKIESLFEINITDIFVIEFSSEIHSVSIILHKLHFTMILLS